MLDRDLPERIKRTLSDPLEVCRKLGLITKNAVRQARGVIILCPWHGEKTPSCSVRVSDGTIAVKCHGCGQGADVLSLIAQVRGMSMRSDFKRVLEEAASLANMSVDSVPAPAPRAEPEPDRDYPPRDEILEFWNACVPCSSEPEVDAWLRARGRDPGRVDGGDLARAIPADLELSRWASFRGATWWETGHHLIVPMFDASGELRSVRAGRVVENDTPKRLPPGGFRASGLVMACELARAWLRGTWRPTRIIVCEGEPDFLMFATKTGISAHARIGITSGAWTDELANKVPSGCDVKIATDHDKAGNKYAQEIASSIGERCSFRRMREVRA